MTNTFKTIQTLGLSLLLALASLASLQLTNQISASAASINTRVSVDNNGSQANRDSQFSSISEDGRYVSFKSDATNLVAGDTNNFSDIFVRDMVTNVTTRVSVSSEGAQANGLSTEPEISNDGRYVVFTSNASNLVANPDNNGTHDVFLHDRIEKTTELISVTPTGTAGLAHSTKGDVSKNGRYIVFKSFANNLVPGDTVTPDIFIRDRELENTKKITAAPDGQLSNDDSNNAVVNCDGTVVAFSSRASNLSPNDVNAKFDVFYINLAGDKKLHNITSGANEASVVESISCDGNSISFISYANNIIANDSNNRSDIFVHDIPNSATERVSVASNGAQGISDSYNSSISNDGRYITFGSNSDNFGIQSVNGMSNVYKHDRRTRITVQISVSTIYRYTFRNSTDADISGDGRHITFTSWDNSLIVGDTNEKADIFVNRPLDTATPVVTGVPDRTTNTNGWYNKDVTIDWRSEDPSPTSGTPTDPPDTLATTEGKDVSYTSGPSCDPSGNCATGSLVLSVDKTKPSVLSSFDQAYSADDWSNTDITVKFACNDALSGIDTCTGPVTVSTEGDNQNVEGKAEDKAGNMAAVTATVRIDKTNPSMDAQITPTPTLYGWNANDVTIGFTCKDGLSGIIACPEQVAVSSLQDGEQEIVRSVQDKAGNSASIVVPVKIDKTSPSVTSVNTGAHPMRRSQSTFISAHARDNMSGIGSGEFFIDADPGVGKGTPMFNLGSGLGGSLTDPGLKLGRHYIGVRAKDKAGNWSSIVWQQLIVAP